MAKLRYKDGDQWKSIAPSQKEFDDFRGNTETKLTEHNENLAQMASLSYVDALLASLGNGAPKEAFFSLAALIAKYPSGTTSPMLVFDSTHHDGAHVYMWSVEENSWKDIGTYQGIEVVDGSITTEKFHPDIRDKMIAILAAMTTEGQPWEGN